MELLTIKDLKAGYIKNNYVLKGIYLTIHKKETVAIVGKNGAGKSTLAKAILNIAPIIHGEIKLKNNTIFDKETRYETNRIISQGIGYFIQGGKIFPNLSVEENLRFAGLKLDRLHYKSKIESIKKYFGVLLDKRMKASFLSGGEQHQLALAMVMMREPELLLLDEPSAGLSPINRNKLFDIIHRISRDRDIGILLIEQNVKIAVDYSDRILKLELGKFTKEESSKNLKDLKDIDEFFWN